MPKVSVMIPSTIGGLPYLADLMPGLSQEAINTDSEIIIIDNCSRDGTPNYLSNFGNRPSTMTLILNKENLGFAKANNQAARIAQGEYLLLLNNDTIVTPGLIKEMLNTFECDPSIGIVGPLILSMGDNQVLHCGVMFNSDYVAYELGPDVPGVTPGILRSDPRVKSVREVPGVTFACAMIKRECWDAVGGLDEGYVNGWEDNDFVLKARMKGWKVWYTGQTSIQHKKHGTPIRFGQESQNRARFDQIWVTSGKAREILGDRREM